MNSLPRVAITKKDTNKPKKKKKTKKAKENNDELATPEKGINQRDFNEI